MMNQRLVLFMMSCCTAFSFGSEQAVGRTEACRVPTLLTLSLQAVGKNCAEKLHTWVHSGNLCQVPLQEVVSDFSMINTLLKDSTGVSCEVVIEKVREYPALLQHLGIHAAFSSQFFLRLPIQQLSCFDKSGSFLVSSSVGNGQAPTSWQVMCIKNGYKVVYQGNNKSAIAGFRFTTNGKWLVVIGIDGILRLHRVDNFDDFRVLSALSNKPYAHTMNNYKFIATSDERFLIVEFGVNGDQLPFKRVSIIDLKKDECTKEYDKENVLGCSANEQSLITTCPGNPNFFVCVREIATGTVQYEAFRLATLSSGGHYLYVSQPVAQIPQMSSTYDIIDLASFQKVASLPGFVNAQSDDGNIVNLVVDGKSEIWNVKSHQCLLRLPRVYNPCTVKFSPDNRLIACSCHKAKWYGAHILDIATQKITANFQGFDLKAWITGTPLVLLQRSTHPDSVEPQWLKAIPDRYYFIADIENHKMLRKYNFNFQLVEGLVKYGKIVLVKPPIENSFGIASVSLEDRLKDDLARPELDLFNALALSSRLGFLDYLLKTERELFASREGALDRYVLHTSSLGGPPAVYSLDCLLKEATQQVLQRLTNQPRNVLETVARYSTMIDVIDRGIAYERLQENPELQPLKRQCTDPQ